MQLGVHAALSRRRSRVQIPSGPPPSSHPPRAGRAWLPGRVAQLVERAPEKREVTGSTPVPTTGSALNRTYVARPWQHLDGDPSFVKREVVVSTCPTTRRMPSSEPRPPPPSVHADGRAQIFQQAHAEGCSRMLSAGIPLSRSRDRRPRGTARIDVRSVPVQEFPSNATPERPRKFPLGNTGTGPDRSYPVGQRRLARRNEYWGHESTRSTRTRPTYGKPFLRISRS